MTLLMQPSYFQINVLISELGFRKSPLKRNKTDRMTRIRDAIIKKDVSGKGCFDNQGVNSVSEIVSLTQLGVLYCLTL